MYVFQLTINGSWHFVIHTKAFSSSYHQTQSSNPVVLPVRDSMSNETAGLTVGVVTISTVGICRISTVFTLCVHSKV